MTQTEFDLEVDRLNVSFRTKAAVAHVVTDVSFRVPGGKTLGIVGESGSGKTVSALAIMRLLPRGVSEVSADRLSLRGLDLLSLDDSAINKVRGKNVSMIYQEPMASLNPVFSVGVQIAEVVRHHMGLDRRGSWRKAVESLDRVGIPEAAKRAADYPHQFSGGMRQRVMIAMAIVTRPWLLIADEPTTALDTTVQSSILDLLNELRREDGMSMIFVSHDLGVIWKMADDVAVMYAGQIVEYGASRDVFRNPRHPYTEGLLQSSPHGAGSGPLHVIPGSVPNPGDWPTGCRFQDRCPYVVEECAHTEKDGTIRLRGPADRQARCIRTDELVLKGVKS